MKTSLHLITLICFALANTSQAGLGYWDANGADGGAGATPTGTWGADNYWSMDTYGTAPTTAWITRDIAVFSAGTDATNPFIVSVSGTQTASGLVFEEAALTLSGGTIAMWATPFSIAAHGHATIDSVLTGFPVFTKTGTGTLRLNATNLYTGATVVSSGVLAAGNALVLGTTSAGTTISNGATLEISGGIALNEPLTVYGTGVAGTGALRSGGGSNFVSVIRLDQGPLQSGCIGSAAGVLTLGRVDAGQNYELTLVGDGDTIISGGGPTDGLFWGGVNSTLVKQGNGTMTINGLIAIRGTLAVANGTVKLGDNHRFINQGQDYPDLLVNGVFDLNGFSENIEGLRGVGTIINGGTSTLVIGVGEFPWEHHDFGGVISGGTTLIKEDGDSQDIYNHQTYTGDTIIRAGTLALWGSVSNSPTINVVSGGIFTVSPAGEGFVLNGNQTLTGGGVVTGMVVVATGGRIRPGDGVGILTLSGPPSGYGGLDLTAGGTNVWELAANTESGPGTNFDQLAFVRGAQLVLGGASTLRLQFVGSATAPDSSHPFWREPRIWNIVSGSNVVSNFAAIENGSHSAGNFSTSVDANGVWLTFTPNVTRPRITTVSGAGTSNVTVSYTNAWPGTNYVLSYNTNLSTTNWFTVGSKTAENTGDSQTDTSATNSQRHYRVHYVTP